MSAAEHLVGATLVPRRRRAVRSGLVRGGALVFASTLVWHASNFLFNAVTARLLGPSGYAELAATVTIIYVSSPVLTSIQTMMSRAATSLQVAGSLDRIRPLVDARARVIALVALAVAAGCSALSHQFARFLHLSSGWPIVIVFAGLCVSGVTHCQRGALQGTQLFGRYAASTVVEATTKVVGAAALVGLVSRSPAAAVAAVPIAALCAFVVNSALLRALPRGRRTMSEQSFRGWGDSWRTVATFGFLSILLSADVLAAKHYLPSQTAGVYAAVSLSGKVVYFATSALSFFLFPLFSEQRERKLDARRHLALALGALCACSLLLIAAYVLMPRLVIDPLFGARYSGAAPYLGLIAVAFAGYAVAYLAATYLLAQGARLGAAVLAVATAAQLAGLYFRHESIAAIVDVQAVVFWGAALVLCAVALTARSHEAGASS